jgi:hypothetical protein
MRNSNRRSSWMFSLSVLIGSGAGVLVIPGCTSDEWIAELPDGSSQGQPGPDGSSSDARSIPDAGGGVADGEAADGPAEGDASPDAATIPTCSASQVCVEYTPAGPECLPSCAGIDAGGCPSGEVCTSTSGCCIGTGCSAVSVSACCPPSGCDSLPDAGARQDAGVLPTCSADQRCVEYTPAGPACLPACSGIDAGGCPSGEVCTRASGCCLGTACSAVSVLVCCPPSGCN